MFFRLFRFPRPSSSSTSRFFATVVRLPSLKVFEKSKSSLLSTAVSSQGSNFRYADLLKDSNELATKLKDTLNCSDLSEKRVAFLCPATYEYVVAQWATWQAGGLAVPLCVTHPTPELEYYIQDSQASVLVGHSSFRSTLQPIAEKFQLPYVEISDFSPPALNPIDGVETVSFDCNRRAMLIYTSGTTGKPKGVVYTHRMIEAQANALIDAWKWTSTDHILNILPLHHVHGVINVVTCALTSGAKLTMLPKFSGQTVWQYFQSLKDLTLFMAVPTVYSRLISVYDNMNADQKTACLEACQRMRLMVSGSAALPVPTMEKWREISGHTLLERYGMTETGMVLSNVYQGKPKPGFVGRPLPGVEVKMAGNQTEGELLVKGDNVFREYWNRPQATAESFDEEGWFKTGDIVTADEEGDYRIMGRASVDIIKSSGYKISSLEIEREIMAHPNMAECAVVGLPDDTYGQIIAVFVVTKQGKLTVEELKSWLSSRLAPYKVPRQLKQVHALPRNAMGKISKKSLVQAWNDTPSV
eukprot:TRINITY_DN8757_c0_g1_i1.p1 TRINITY_DN8757_c0_g1~~TRINITY_DN8757_c0_g1_i1.p1  ORF type:complete len:528 (-),score=41.34 TRINITY_DN8757_c0_g1_i1:110-1693(-)